MLSIVMAVAADEWFQDVIELFFVGCHNWLDWMALAWAMVRLLPFSLRSFVVLARGIVTFRM